MIKKITDLLCEISIGLLKFVLMFLAGPFLLAAIAWVFFGPFVVFFALCELVTTYNFQIPIWAFIVLNVINIGIWAGMLLGE